MKLSTGKIAFPIEFDNGDKEKIYFNPNDPDLVLRMKNLHKNIKIRVDELEDAKLDATGNPIKHSDVANFEKLRKVVCEELDFAFGGEVSSVVFKYCSPFAIVDGQYFIMQFITAIAPEIEKEVNKATEKMTKHIGKYVK